MPASMLVSTIAIRTVRRELRGSESLIGSLRNFSGQLANRVARMRIRIKVSEVLLAASGVENGDASTRGVANRRDASSASALVHSRAKSAYVHGLSANKK